jgi:hypothetical protein
LGERNSHVFGFVNRHRIRHGCCGEENIIKQAGWLKSASLIVSEEYIRTCNILGGVFRTLVSVLPYVLN